MTDAESAPAASAAETPPHDRTISPISGRFAAGPKGKALVLAGLTAGCAALALAGSHARTHTPKPPEQPARQVVAFEPATPPTLDRPGPAAPSLTGGPAGPGLSATEASGAAAGPRAAPTAGAPDPVAAMRASPLLAYGGGAAAGAVPALQGVANELRPARVATELDELRRGSTIGESKARRLGDRSFLILAGTTIPCILQTAIDTSTPGYVSCVIPQDVYSDNGTTVLMEKGAKVLGEYRSSLKQGQNRLFVLWTRAVTPNGIAIDLAAPASDALGRAGFDGDLDRHFWERFGGALLLSIVDDGTAALAPRTGAGETVRVPSDAAGVALSHTVDMAPTLRKPQGSEVAIFAAQDFDFSGVYALKAR
jgi:type IV secretion system protein VirB10